MSNASIKLDPKFLKRAQGRFGNYDFKVGILQDSAHMKANTSGKLSAYAGGPVRKKTRKPSGLSVAQVSERLRKFIGVNFYKVPFKSKTNKDILSFRSESNLEGRLWKQFRAHN
jgi:hypothetical protein